MGRIFFLARRSWSNGARWYPPATLARESFPVFPGIVPAASRFMRQQCSTTARPRRVPTTERYPLPPDGHANATLRTQARFLTRTRPCTPPCCRLQAHASQREQLASGRPAACPHGSIHTGTTDEGTEPIPGRARRSKRTPHAPRPQRPCRAARPRATPREREREPARPAAWRPHTRARMLIAAALTRPHRIFAMQQKP